MIRARPFILLALALTLGACEAGETPLAPPPPEPSNSDPSLTGTFHGIFNGLYGGEVMLAANVQFALAESGGAVVGAFGIQGILDDGVTRSNVAGTGTLSGTVAVGDVAAVSLTAASDLCLHSSAFTGAYHRRTGVLGVDGVVHVFDQFCRVVAVYPVSMAMRR